MWKIVRVEFCTSRSYDFMDILVDKDRCNAFLETIVAVDGYRYMSKIRDREEYKFSSDPHWIDYKAVTKICNDYSKMNACEPLDVGMNRNGFFCASIIASQKLLHR